MNEYWIIIDGVPRGPYAAHELRSMNLPELTPVWREGMTDWVYLRDLADLNESEVEEVVVELEEEGTVVPPPLPDSESQAYDEPRQFTDQKHEHAGKPELQPCDEPAPSYLGWSIASIVLCCVPLGIVSLIYSLKVNSYNNAGDFARARKCSRTAELWLITTITLGLVLSPLVMLIQMASALG